MLPALALQVEVPERSGDEDAERGEEEEVVVEDVGVLGWWGSAGRGGGGVDGGEEGVGEGRRVRVSCGGCWRARR